MPKKSRLLTELAHQPVSGYSMFCNPDVQSEHDTHPNMTTTTTTRIRVPKRPVKPVPESSVLMECTTCLEEQLWSQAFASLSSEITAGADTHAPARLPPPQYLALAATLTVHPSFTTRTDDPLKHRASDDALKYLRKVVAAVDPVDAGLRDAFRFGRAAGRQAASKRGGARAAHAHADSSEERHHLLIRNQYANEQSLANHAEHFWAAVGWAFNCSVKHRARWQRWQAWLELMLDTLQADLTTAAPGDASGEGLSGTLIAHYLSAVEAGRHNRRKIMRAILADGSSRSTGEFPEIWRNETKLPKKRESIRSPKRQRLDVDNGEFGDYFDDDSDQHSPETRARKSRSAAARRSGAADDNVDESDDYETGMSVAGDFGGPDSVRLRQRFLGLLTSFVRADDQKRPMFVDIEELFSLFTEFIKPLPLTVFQQFVLPQTPYIDADFHASLLDLLSRPLLGSSTCNGPIDQAEFERSFASCAAVHSSVEDNAKVSLIIESLLRALWEARLLSNDPSRLKALVLEGVQARTQKVASDGRRKTVKRASADDEARTVMQCSADRMDVLLAILVA